MKKKFIEAIIIKLARFFKIMKKIINKLQSPKLIKDDTTLNNFNFIIFLFLKLDYELEKLKIKIKKAFFLIIQFFESFFLANLQENSLLIFFLQFFKKKRTTYPLNPKPAKIDYCFERNLKQSPFPRYFFKSKLIKKTQPETVYPTSNDNFIISQVSNINKTDQIFIGIGNLDSLNLLSYLNPELIIFVDTNYSQLEYLNYILELIKKSESRSEFIGNFFSKSSQDIEEKILNNLKTIDNQKIEELFWSLPSLEKKFSTEWSLWLTQYQVLKDKDNKSIGISYKKIGQNVFGKLGVVTSLVLDQKKQIFEKNKNIDFFPLIKKNGFLCTEENYRKLKKLLLTTPITMLNKSLSGCFIDISQNFQYKTQVYWLSNLFGTWEFYFKEIKNLSRQISQLIFMIPSDFNIYLIEDHRSPFFPKIKPIPSTHWETLNIVNRYLQFPCLELTNNLQWAKKKYSNLPFSQYMLIGDFLKLKKNVFKSVFFHTLTENIDLETFKATFEKSLKLFKRIVILEHYFPNKQPSRQKINQIKQILENKKINVTFFKIKRKSKGENFIFILEQK